MRLILILAVALSVIACGRPARRTTADGLPVGDGNTTGDGIPAGR